MSPKKYNILETKFNWASCSEVTLILFKNEELVTYTKYEDIPEVFDHVIKFLPSFPDGPHTEEQHEEMAIWNDRLHELVKRERNNAGSV